MSDASESFGDDDNGGSRPNYLARRLAFTGLIVAVIALVAILVGRVIGTGTTEPDRIDVDTAWNKVVTVNQHTGRVTMSDPDGSEVEGFSTNTGRVTAAAMIDDIVFVAGGRASVATALAGDRERLDVSDLLEGDITLARPSGSTEMVMFSNGSEAVFMGGAIDRFIDTTAAIAATGVELSLDEARANVGASAVLLPDPGNFQSVLLRFGDEPPTYFAGVPLAVDDDRVSTVQNVGGSATVTLSDHEGVRLAEFTTQPVLAAMLVDDGILTVDSDGVIHLLRPGGDEAVGSLGAMPTEGWVTTTGDRLVVVTDEGVAVIGPDGSVRSSTPGARPATTGPAPPSTTPLRPGCLPLSHEREGLLLSNLRNGEVVVEVARAVAAVLTSTDGCTAVAGSAAAAGGDRSDASTDGATIMSFDGERVLTNDHDAVLALSPDGGTVAIERAGRLAVEEVTSVDPDTDSEGRADDAEDEPDPEPDGDEGNGDESDGDESDGDRDLGAATPFVFFADL